MLSLTLFSKVTCLICVLAISFVMTFLCKPFNYLELNKIEHYSLLSAMVILFSGAFYVCDIKEEFKIIPFFLIIFVNIIFCFNWLLSFTSILFHANLNKLQAYFPNYTYSIVALIMAIQQTEMTFNLIRFFKIIKQKFKIIRSNLINIYEKNEGEVINGDDKNRVPQKSRKSRTKVFFQIFDSQKENSLIKS